MGGFFSMDGTFAKIGNGIADIFILGLLWLVVSVPVFTMGAATSALFYVTTKRVSGREGYLMKDFFKSFKANFVQATVAWVLMLCVFALLWVNGSLIASMENPPFFLLPINLFCAIELLLVWIYLFPLIARFHMKTGAVIRAAFFMAHRHLPTTLICVGLMVLLGTGLSFLPMFMPGAMGVYAMVASYPLMAVFRKYHPQMDKDTVATPEEKTARSNIARI